MDLLPSSSSVPRQNQNVHRRFKTVDAYVSELAGDKARVITKILIANNGVAAVKAIRSIRQWTYDVFGNEKAITFVVMATPEDFRYVFFVFDIDFATPKTDHFNFI
jgi:hypothetical protein